MSRASDKLNAARVAALRTRIAQGGELNTASLSKSYNLPETVVASVINAAGVIPHARD